MLLLVGLGNPGEKYARNRHNVGFMAVDAIADRHGFTPPRRRFDGIVREGRLGPDKALVLKPMTYMNESGRSVAATARFFKISPSHVVVFYDELDLPPGKLRMKVGGGAAGHNGIRSMTRQMGADFRRARIGIGHPGDKSRVQSHVLGDFKKADGAWLGPMLAALADNADALVDGDSQFMNRVHLALAEG
ncbi:MAG: aminoacyl-tRNA hydrolase [Pseudomonadota bacterium]